MSCKLVKQFNIKIEALLRKHNNFITNCFVFKKTYYDFSSETFHNYLALVLSLSAAR